MCVVAHTIRSARLLDLAIFLISCITLHSTSSHPPAMSCRSSAMLIQPRQPLHKGSTEAMTTVRPMIITSSVLQVCGHRMIFFFQAEDGIRDADVTGVQTCALPISSIYGHKSRLSIPLKLP